MFSTKQGVSFKTVSLRGQFVETAENFEYLATVLDSAASLSVSRC